MGALVAGPDGIILGRFGWADLTTGQANNAPTGNPCRLGLALPVIGTWQKVYRQQLAGGPWVNVLRAGLGVTLAVRGDFWVRFAGGAWPGQPVYASEVDGSALAGYATDYQLTPWTVITKAAPGCLAIISTWSTFT
jgi:hypothetical protein